MLLRGEAGAPAVTRSRLPNLAVLGPWATPPCRCWRSRPEQPARGRPRPSSAEQSIPSLAPDVRRPIRHRLGTAFGAALRK